MLKDGIKLLCVCLHIRNDTLLFLKLKSTTFRFFEKQEKYVKFLVC